MLKILHYLGYGECHSKCGYEIKDFGGEITVILTELKDNPGTSVTNKVEFIASLIYSKYLSDKPVSDIKWIEHYPRRGKIEETFDLVELTWLVEKKMFITPRWSRLSKQELEYIHN